MRNIEINLLPWRQEIYRQKIKSFIYKSLASLIICLTGVTFILYLTQKIDTEIDKKREQIQQIDNKLAEIKQNISTLQRNYGGKSKNLKKLPNEQFLSILTTISKLPLQSGELNELSLDFEKLILQGETEKNNEVEQLQKFLKQQNLFSSVKLLTFKEQQIDQRRSVIFEFELSLTQHKE
ncbi:PilN domain-containing protein [Histophilus somni]|uniref:PilN domain-containing protein n=1 Tax=Histophilus somni TaxID=731 RepID=UPI00201F621C|nr:PilN domain-containing protein [Histophilus somni]